MPRSIYIYGFIAQDGASPVHVAGAGSIPVLTPGCGTAEEFPATHQTDPVGDQALRLVGQLLRQVPPTGREGMGLFMGTRFGCLEDDRNFQRSRLADGGKYASPAAFRRTLPSTLAAELSIAFAIRGPLIVFAENKTPARRAILHALHWINSGRLDSAIAGSFDYFVGHTGKSTTTESGICRTMLCLLGTDNAFPGLTPWAAITPATVKTATDALSQAENGNFEPLMSAMNRPTVVQE